MNDQYNNTFNGLIKPYANSSIPVYMESNGSIISASVPVNSSLYYMHFTNNHTAISGVPIQIFTFAPIYQELSEYSITFQYGNYMVILNTYGMNKTYNYTYAFDIAKHMVSAFRQ
jgi:hypothetical protein